MSSQLSKPRNINEHRSHRLEFSITVDGTQLSRNPTRGKIAFTNQTKTNKTQNTPQQPSQIISNEQVPLRLSYWLRVGVDGVIVQWWCAAIFVSELICISIRCVAGGLRVNKNIGHQRAAT